jgi:hypothetical protein
LPLSTIDTRLLELTAAKHACITAAHRSIASVARTVGVGSAVRHPLTKLATRVMSSPEASRDSTNGEALLARGFRPYLVRVGDDA